MKSRKITIILFMLILLIFVLNTGISRSAYNWYSFSKINFVEREINLANANVMNIGDLIVDNKSITGNGQQNDPFINIPLENEYMHSLRLNIEVTTNDVLQLFYLNEGEEGFNEIKSLKFSLDPGNNLVELKIPYEDSSSIMESIRIDPVQTDQHFLIKDIFINK
ncbi:hypothetical protein NSS98_28570 [Paenibacillus sp. FSL E2-0274]|uniref:hypothetical protein n=1 Tax=Paenibacillus TaxID=44249 RepID=UPI00096C598F|nr:hypothetical protein [Paenibacillus odorifer]OME35281.1 hypothetical protein BSK63_07250 [Paenibacillus odorifer]OME42685.1 hypothetical protein BSK46_02475 [Paenibacillus odorifer]